MSLLSMCRTTGTLRRKTAVKDTSGGHSTTFTDVGGAAGIACDIQPASSTTQLHYMQNSQSVTHSVYVAASISPKAGDIWTSNGRTFLFHGYDPTPPGYSGWPGVLHVEEVDP